MTEINWDALKDDAKGILKDTWGDVLEGAEGDIEHFYDAVANDFTRALAAGDDDILDELGEQMLVLAEINRVRFVRESKEAAVRGMRLAFKVGRSLLGAVL